MSEGKIQDSQFNKDLQELEKDRLLSLTKAVVRARWFFVLIYAVFGLISSQLGEYFGKAIYSSQESGLAFAVHYSLIRIVTAVFVIYNITITFVLRKKNISLKNVKLLAYSQLVFDTIFVLVMFYATGSIEGQGVLLLFFPVIIAAILFTPKIVALVSFGVVAAAGAIVHHEFNGILPHVSLYNKDIASKLFDPAVSNSWTVGYSYFAVAAGVISVAVYFALTSRILRKVEDSLKQKTLELTSERNKIEAVVTNLIEGLIILDGTEKISMINPEAKGTLGIKSDEVYGKKISEINNVPYLQKLYEVLGKNIEWTGKKYEITFGEILPRYFQVITNPVITREGEKIGLMIVLHDITREKEIENLKTEFVSIAAHQLRTPLSAIKWTLKMALDGDAGKLTKEQAELLEGGYVSNERMIDMVNDLLNVARIEEGRFIYDMSLVDIDELIKQEIETIKPLLAKNNIKLEYTKSDSELPQVEADKEKIQLVIQNLVENAIKYTLAEGSVTITLNSDNINIEVMVQDSGIGIPQQQQEKMFNKFFRADNAMKAGVEGTGMGLFICKSIVEKHGGRVWFESEEGKGTKFWFTLPTKKIMKK